MGQIAIVLGTKAEFLRLFPLMHFFQKKGEPYTLIHTRQNFLGEYLEEFRVFPETFIDFEEFHTIKLKFNLTNAVNTWRVYRKLRKTLQSLAPSRVVYQGDTFTTGFAALASERTKTPSAHIEAGFRSGSWREPFPEEMIRAYADRKADILYAPSVGAVANLDNEGLGCKAVLSGSTIMDGLNWTGIYSEQAQDFALVTLHRYENIFSKRRMKNILSILSIPKTHMIWLMHETTRTMLERRGLMEEAESLAEIRPTLPYPEFMRLVSACKYVITDGGSLEEEALILGKPCLLLRKKTERSEAVECGLTFLSELDLLLARMQLEFIEGEECTMRCASPFLIGGKSASEIIGEHLLGAS